MQHTEPHTTRQVEPQACPFCWLMWQTEPSCMNCGQLLSASLGTFTPTYPR